MTVLEVPGRTGPRPQRLTVEQRQALRRVRLAHEAAHRAGRELDEAVAQAWDAGVSLTLIGKSFAGSPSGASRAAARRLDRALLRRLRTTG